VGSNGSHGLSPPHGHVGLAYCDGVDGAVRVVYRAQLRDVFHDRIIQLQQAAIAKLHDGNAGECFGDGGPMPGGVPIHFLAFLAIGVAVEFFGDHFVVVDQGEAAADNSVLFHARPVEILQGGQFRKRGCECG
jgi:hypothetical protein